MSIAKLSTAIITILIIVLLCAVPAFGETENIYIEELDMTVGAPDGGYILTRNLDENHPYLEEFNTTVEDTLDLYEDLSIYFEYINTDPLYSISIDRNEYIGYHDYFNYSIYSDEELLNIGEEYIETWGSPDDNYTGIEIFSAGNIKYIVYDYWYEYHGNNYYLREYITIYNGQLITIQLNGYYIPLTSDMTIKAETIVASIKFGEIPLYKDIYFEEFEMNITLPNDAYITTRDLEEDSPILAEYVMTREELLDFFDEFFIYMQYVNMDSLYGIDFMGNQSDLSLRLDNFDQYSDQELEKIAQEYMEEDKNKHYLAHSLDNIGGIQYIVIDSWESTDDYKAYMKSYYTVHNSDNIIFGLYSFGAPPTTEMVDAYLKILNTVEFPNDPPATPQESNNSSSVLLWVLLGAIIVIAALVFIVIRNSNRTQKDDSLPAEQNNVTPVNEPEDVQETPSPDSPDSIDNDD